MSLSSYRLNEPDVSAEDFRSEILAVDLKTGHYHSLRDAAVPVWRLLMEGRDVPTIVAWLAPVYGLTADAMAAEIVPFVATLEKANLIVATPRTASSDGATPPPWLAELSPVYAQPLLETYTEMQDLLLLDPIHDVGEAGWPSLPEAPKKES